ncbi:DUF1513 domain-containing protein [Comamonas composti]|uniref:DUF1513 domain-containing protein n=1 Tax=Comamonas composti TaxID=408558 RepID=UPI0003F73E08|nr:DUF1513 domain-containing protein [Comamonas composti]
MPTGTEGLRRRNCLQAMVLLAAMPLARAGESLRQQALAAAWLEGESMWVGVVRAEAAPGQPLHVLQAVEVPTRAHGMARLRDDSLVFASRRPGDWLLRLRPGQSAEQAQWLWIEPDRRFNGHVIESADGRHLYTTETDLEDGQGVIGVRDAASLEKIAEWRSGGMDPHQLLLDADGSLMVANGGIPTQSETGRRKLRLDHMDSSIARLLPAQNGVIAGQWRLEDTRLSLRHLAWGPRIAYAAQRRWLGIALQAEHDSARQRAEAPVLALFDGQRLHAAPLPAGRSFGGYGGDIGSNGRHFVVSCPRTDSAGWWQVPDRDGEAGECFREVSLKGVYCVANASVSPGQAGADGAPARALWLGGSQLAQLHAVSGREHEAGTAGMQLDNHWIPLA